MNKKLSIILLLLVATVMSPFRALAAGHDEEEEKDLDVQEIIFHHLGDGYGWEVPFSHVYRIPLPVIVRAEDGKWFCFSSSRLTEVTVEENMETGKKHEYLSPVIHKEIKDGKEEMVT